MDRKEFESDLLSNNISEKYLNKSNEELEERFGSEFLKTVNYGSQNNINHIYDLFEHILKTVDNLDVSGLSEKDALTIKIAAFFHDIGKPDVAQLNQKTGQTQFIGHAKQSAEIAKDILAKIGYSDEDILQIAFLIQSHDDFIQISKNEEVTEDRISKILANTMKKSENYQPTISDFEHLIRLCEADAMSQNTVIEKNGEIVDTQKNRIERLEAIKGVLSRALSLKQESEIAKLEKQKQDIINGPSPIEKKGKIVNQKQIDLWNAMTEEEKNEKLNGIDKQITIMQNEIARLLELEPDLHSINAKKLEESMEESKRLSEKILENEKQKMNGVK